MRAAPALQWSPASGCEGSVLFLHQMEVLVHRHPAAPHIWCLTALEAGYDLLELKAQSELGAQHEALVLLQKVLHRRLQGVKRVLQGSSQLVFPL